MSTISHEAATARDRARAANGRFGEQVRSGPEVAITPSVNGSVPVVIESPVGADYERNLWVKLEPGQETTFHISGDGIGAPGESWSDDTLTIRRDGDEVVASYSVDGGDIGDELAAALDILPASDRGHVVDRLRERVAASGGPGIAVDYDDGRLQFRSTSRHATDTDGGVHTASIMHEVAASDAGRFLRYGWHETAVAAVLDEEGFDS